MSAKTDLLVRLKGERLVAIAQMRELESGGTMSRRSGAEFDGLARDVERLDKQIRDAGGSFDARRTQGTVGEREEDGSATLLKPEERVSDYLRDRGKMTLPGGLEELGAEPFGVGRLIRAAVTGEGTEIERRALAEGVLSTGGYLLPTPLAGTMIDRVRAATRVFQAGAVTVPMEFPTLKLARLATAGAAVSWHSENSTITPSAMAFEGLTLQAQTLPVLVQISMELFEDLTPEASNLIEHELAACLSLELDRACLRGSGVAPILKGVLNQSGVGTTSLGANGATAVWDNVVDSVGSVRAANIEPTGILWASRTAQWLGKQKTSTGEYLPVPPVIADIPRFTTNQIPTNLTQGTSSLASEVYTGRWSDLLVGIRTDLRFAVRVLSERYIDSGMFGLMCYLRADCVLAHPESFNVLTGVL